MPTAAAEFYVDSLVHFVEKTISYCVTCLPYLEDVCMEILDACFAPKQILRQIGMIGFLQVFLFALNSGHKGLTAMLGILTAKGRKLKKLYDQLHNVSSYSEWRNIACLIDEIQQHDVWRKIDESSLYDCHMLKKRIKHTSEMLNRGDVFNLMFRLRGGLSRDQFGMQHEGLYTKALAGTKLVVEKYHDTMCAALNFICDTTIMEDEIPLDARLAFFNETRHAYGRTALLLSGGAYLGYYHLGVLRALLNEGLLPRVISGASAGSAITAAVGTRTDEELADFLGTFDRIGAPSYIDSDLFLFSTELKSPVARRLHYLVPSCLQWLSFPILSIIFENKFLNLDTEHFKRTLMHNYGQYTFQEAFDRTGRVINITVAPMNNYDPPRLLNYLTAPHVCVWSAAAASCALPGVFDAVPLIVKEPNGQYRPENEWTRQAIDGPEDAKKAANHNYSDGSIENDLPMQQLSELFNVNHFIVSQVNPHTAVLSSLNTKATVWSNPVYGALVGYLRFLMSQCRDWLKNILSLLIFRSKAPLWSTRRGLAQALTQEYEGRPLDITITPWQGHISPLSTLTHIIRNPTPEEYSEVTNVSEKNTWPFISRIRGHCLIEMTLDKCVQRLRKRITEENERQQNEAARQMRKQTSTGHKETRSATLDRTPSFYTSRSIVNLSGLSVSDPLPPAQQARRHGSGNNLLALQQQQQQQQQQQNQPPTPTPADSVPPPRLADIWALHRNTSYDSQVPAADDQASSNDWNDFLTLNVSAGEVRLSSPPSSDSGLDDEDLRAKLVPSASNDNLKEEIYKTTRMANFYYRNGVSDGAIDTDQI